MDDRGRRADLHALRHSYGTLLSKGGVSPREAMSLMRHTDLRLTMKMYTDPRIFDLSGAVEKLQLQLGKPSDSQGAAATGTDGKPAGDDAGRTKSVTTPSAGIGNCLAAIGKRSGNVEPPLTLASDGDREQLAGIGGDMRKERAMGVEPTTASLEG
jgi:hypothetical protein